MFIRPEELKGLLVQAGFEFREFRWHVAGREHSQNDQPAAEKSQKQNRLQGAWPEIQARRKPRLENPLYGIRRQTVTVMWHSYLCQALSRSTH